RTVAPDDHARPGTILDARMPAAALLVRAHFLQACRQALRRGADPRRRRNLLRARGIPPVAADGARLQGAATPRAGLSAVAGLRLRIRARPARDRCDQRQRSAAAMGRRSGGVAGGSRGARSEGRDRVARRARGVPVVLTRMQTARDITGYRKHWAERFGTAPFLPMSREEMDTLGWDSCDIIIVTGDAYVDHPSFGMAIVGRVLEAQGFRVGMIAQPDWHSAQAFAALGRPNLFFGITAGNMDSMVNRYTADRRVRSDDAYTPQGIGGKRPDRSVIVYAQRAREAFKD